MIFLRPKTRLGQAGATIVEVLVAIALTGIFMPVLATALVAAHAGRASSIQQLQAQSLIKEATEAVRNVREKGWANVATDGTYHPVPGTSDWSLASGAETINGFTWQIVISTPQRNAAGTIVTSGGTNDPSTKHVAVTVAWNKPTVGSLSTDTYLTRWLTNTVWTQTTQADFTGGTLANTCAATTCDSNPNFALNSVQLQDTSATWQLPSVFGGLKIGTGVAANDVYYTTINSHNYALVGYATGLAIINVDNPSAPVLTRTYTTTAAVNGVFAVGNIAYLATAITNAQFEQISLSDPATTAPTLTRSFQITDNNNTAATSIFVSGTFAYVGKKQVTNGLFGTAGEFNVLNLSGTNVTLSDNLNIAADINAVWVNGNYAYLATSRTNQQLTVVNVTTKTNITSSTTVSLGANGTDIAVNAAGTQAYVTTANNTGGAELRVFTVSPTAATATAVGSGYEVGGAANGVNIDTTNPNYLLISTSVASKQLIVVNISAPATAVTLVNNITLGGNGNHLFVVGPYAYVATADTTKGLTVVYAGYRPSGTFESSTFDPASNVGYNYFTFTGTAPSGTTLQFQIAANNTGSGWSYIGPDGTASTYYTAGDSVPLSIVSNRYFRYKATMTTTNGQATPRLDDTGVNYSP